MSKFISTNQIFLEQVRVRCDLPGPEWKWKSVVPEERAALPIVFGEEDNVHVVLVDEANSISAVCATPLPTISIPEEWNSLEKHSALYFSVFLHEFEHGNTYMARVRLQMIKNLLM